MNVPAPPRPVDTMGVFFMLNRFDILLAVLVLVPLDEEALESSFARGVCAAMLADLPLPPSMRRRLRGWCA